MRKIVFIMLVAFISTVSMAVEIQVWEKWQQSSDKIYDDVTKAFEKENPNIKVKRVHFDTEQLNYKFKEAALAGKAPSLVIGPADFVDKFSIMGLIKPIKDVQGFDRNLTNKMLSSSIEQLKAYGEQYGFPEQIGNHLILIYNKKYVEKVPDTWEELIAFSKDFKSKNKGKYGIVLNLGEPYWFTGFIGAYGGSVLDEKNRPTLNTPAVISALKFINRLKNEENILPGELDYGTCNDIFKAGNAAFIINGDWAFEDYRDAIGTNMMIVKIPKVPGGGNFVPMTLTQGMYVPEGLNIEQEQAAAKYMEFLTRKDIQLTIAEANKTIPVNREALEDQRMRVNGYFNSSIAQIALGTPMPVVPEMKVIWETLKPYINEVLNNKMKPEDAAKGMQEMAEKKIDEMNSN